MAGNMKAVKLRIKSVQSTMQITKAMELVASSKLRKAKERAETCRPYFKELHETLKDIYYAERKILKALPKMARAAQDEKLKAADPPMRGAPKRPWLRLLPSPTATGVP